MTEHKACVFVFDEGHGARGGKVEREREGESAPKGLAGAWLGFAMLRRRYLWLSARHWYSEGYSRFRSFLSLVSTYGVFAAW